MEQEALQIVDFLNSESWEEGVGEDWVPWEFSSNGITFRLTFWSIPIWDSENDPREWVDEGTKEDLRNFIIRESENMVEVIKKKMKVLKKSIS
jgi:hypothetical protein